MEKASLTLVLVFIFSVSLVVFASTPSVKEQKMIDIFQSREKEVEAASLAVVASCVSIPKIVLPGVFPVSSSTSFVIPEAITFTESDVSKYLEVLKGGNNNGFFGSLFSRANNNLNPLVKNAISALSSLNLQRGDMILDGVLEIEGGDTVSLLSVVADKDYSDIDIFVLGDFTIKGNLFKNEIKFTGKVEIAGTDENNIVVDTSDVLLNGNPLGLGKFELKVGK